LRPIANTIPMDGNHTTLARPTAFEGGHSVSRLPLVLKGAMIDDLVDAAASVWQLHALKNSNALAAPFSCD
jgi:hypothetical protein